MYQKLPDFISKVLSRQYKTVTPSYEHAALKNTKNTKRIKNKMAMATKNCFSNSKIVTIVLLTVVELSETNIKYATVKKVKPTLFSRALVH